MTTQTRTSELEAVNTILSTIGESPLNTLSGSLPVDGTIAKNVLSEVSREVQSQGWHFNTHYKVTLSRDTDNKIPLATNIVRVELDPRQYSKTSYDIVQRNNFLYNLAKNEDTFDVNFKDVTAVYLLPFDEIPEQAKRYITIRSARIFHDRTLGANTIHKFSLEDEAKSLSILKQAESHTGDYSIFDTPEQAYTIIRGN
ncbi:tail tube A [Pelagibacter phage Eyrgjafa EXVC018P]|uniref:Tail tube A n=1 Tax=Pelagibacter phage Eyrgjafa EXVC018P TaxID=2736227 RepID=A0A7S5Y9G5_9CAUD|nr:tail tube A [Pelagibacter phage Eyrgjafa EXVC018P]QLF88232.1 tail tube A [Pelagibacter phage Gjalp EXVC020P]